MPKFSSAIIDLCFIRCHILVYCWKVAYNWRYFFEHVPRFIFMCMLLDFIAHIIHIFIFNVFASRVHFLTKLWVFGAYFNGFNSIKFDMLRVFILCQDFCETQLLFDFLFLYSCLDTIVVRATFVLIQRESISCLIWMLVWCQFVYL